MQKAKRFWREVAVIETAGGFAITLDGREVRSPAGGGLHLASRPLADAISKEWDSQKDEINPATMPLFGFAATAIDRIAPRRDGVIDEIAKYGGSDLLCYREENEKDLAARQDEIWQPYLDRLKTENGIALQSFKGVMPQAQPDSALSDLRGLVAQYDDFHLAGLHRLVSVSGSLVLGLLVADGKVDAAEAAEAALLDDAWSAEKWGHDTEAATRMEAARFAMVEAGRYIGLLRGGV